MGEILRNSQRLTEEISQLSDPPTVNSDPYLYNPDYQDNCEENNDNKDLILRSSYHLDVPHEICPPEGNPGDYSPDLNWSQKKGKMVPLDELDQNDSIFITFDETGHSPTVNSTPSHDFEVECTTHPWDAEPYNLVRSP